MIIKILSNRPSMHRRMAKLELLLPPPATCRQSSLGRNRTKGFLVPKKDGGISSLDEKTTRSLVDTVQEQPVRTSAAVTRVATTSFWAGERNVSEDSRNGPIIRIAGVVQYLSFSLTTFTSLFFSRLL